MTHYDEVRKATTQVESVQKWSLDKKQFDRDFGTWSYAVLISFLPFFIVFLFFTGPVTNFDFLELFRDNALYYVCVTMSALSLYTYRMISLVRGLHIFILLMGMAIYIFSTSGISIPLFDIYGYDRRRFIAWLFLVSIVVGFFTLVYSSTKKGD